MARPRTKGSVEWVGTDADGHWRARVSVGPKQRRWIDLPRSITRADEPKARAEAKRMADLVATGKFTLPPRRGDPAPALLRAPAGETLTAWSERWFVARQAMGRRSIRADRAKWVTWVLPRLGDKPVASITRVDLEAWVEWIDERVQARALAWKTAQLAWGLVTVAFRTASEGKVKALRARDDNPAEKVAPPDRGVDKAKTYLYPSEFLALVSCEAVPLDVRRAYAVIVYLDARAGEAEALHWEDFDLEHGTVHVHRAADPDTKVVRETKGRAARRFTVEPNLLPLLHAMAAERPLSVRIFEPWPLHKHRADQLRCALKAAGVTRADLFARDLTRKHMTAHDLRATGLTWAAVRGDEPLHLMHRAGHQDLATTMKYVREAENVRVGFGTVFPPLPPCLLGVRGSSPRSSSGGEGHAQTAWKVAARSVQGEGFEPP